MDILRWDKLLFISPLSNTVHHDRLERSADSAKRQMKIQNSASIDQKHHEIENLSDKQGGIN